MIEAEDRDAVTAPDAELRFQRTRRGRDTFGERRIGQRRTRKVDRRLVRRKRRIAVDQVGEVHLSYPSPAGGGSANEVSRGGVFSIRVSPHPAARCARVHLPPSGEG